MVLPKNKTKIFFFFFLFFGHQKKKVQKAPLPSLLTHPRRVFPGLKKSVS